MLSMLEHALEYARHGLYVLPIWPIVDDGAAGTRRCACDDAACVSPGKHPLRHLVPHGLREATTDENTIRAWWTQYPQANIAIALRASGLIAFDVDKPQNVEALTRLQSTVGALPDTLTQRSGSGWYHAIFRAPDFDIRGDLEGITLRGKNYIVVAPSMHISGGIYTWLDWREPAMLPAAWLDAIRRPVELGDGEIPDATSEPAWLQAIPPQVRLERMRAHLAGEQGEVRGTSRPRLTWDIIRTCARGFAMRSRRVVFDTLLEIHNPRCVPPYDERRLATMVDSAYEAATEPAWGSCLAPPPTENIFGESTTLSIPSRDVVSMPQPPVRRYTTGIPELDAKLGGGISTRQETVIMAPPADGKSALAMAISLHVQSTIPVLYASTELETYELMAREAAQPTDFAWRDIVDGKIDRARFANVLPERVHLLGCERLPMGEAALQAIDGETQRLSALYGVPPLVVIDYLQDLARGVDERGLRAKIGGLATIVRAMSQRLDCAMLVISSVSRSYYGMKRAQEMRAAEDATVYLAAAKESGDVDYAAAAVLFLDVVGAEIGARYRCARIAVAKSRHGETGFVGARFFGASGRWQAAPDEVLESAGRREVALKVAEHDETDARVLQAIVQAASEGLYRKSNAWRDLVPDVSQNGVREAIARLTALGRLRMDEMHPIHHRREGKGEFVVPTGAPARSPI